jgi:hypothetical protein
MKFRLSFQCMPFLLSSKTRPTRLLPVVLLFCFQGTGAAADPQCRDLCQAWRLDETASDNIVAAVESAMKGYKPPKDQRRRISGGDSVEAMTRAADEEALGPIHKRPGSDILRDDLLQSLLQSRKLVLAPKGRDIAITRDTGTPQALSIDQPYARVDDFGTAKIRSEWQQDQLVVTETYDRRRKLQRSFRFDKKQASLVLTQAISRPGLAPLKVTSVYRKSP